VADVTVHDELPMLTMLFVKICSSNPEPVILIDSRLLVSIESTTGVKVLDHSKPQFTEHLDGIPLTFTETFKNL
jgi:hypothetical protein